MNSVFRIFWSIFYWEFKKDLKKQLLYLLLSGLIFLIILIYNYHNLTIEINYTTDSIESLTNIFWNNQLITVWINILFLIYLTIDSFLFQKHYVQFLNIYFTNNYIWIFFAKICSYTTKLIIFLFLLFSLHYLSYKYFLEENILTLNKENLKVLDNNLIYINIYYLIHFFFLSFCIIFITFINFLFNILFLTNIYKNKLLLILQIPILFSITILNAVLYKYNFPKLNLLLDPYLWTNILYYFNNPYLLIAFIPICIIFVLVYFSILNKIFIRITKK
jgi:hypothetical protein